MKWGLVVLTAVERDLMQPKKDKPSRWRRVLLYASGLLLLVVLIFPLWLPLVLKGVLGGIGMRVAGIERSGWFGLGLRGVEYGFPGGNVQVEEVDISDWRELVVLGWTSAGQLEGGVVRVRGWTVMLDAERGDVAEGEEVGVSGVGGVLDQVGQVGELLRRWVPPVELEDGAVEMPGLVIRVGHLVYRDGGVVAAVDVPDQGIAGEARLNLDDTNAFRLGVKVGDPWLVDLGVTASGLMEGWDIVAGGRVEGQDLGLSAKYSRDGGAVWPEEFELRLEESVDSGLVERVPGLERMGGVIRGVGGGEELGVDWVLTGKHEEPVVGEILVKGSGRVSLAGGELDGLEVGMGAGSVGLVSPMRVEWSHVLEQLRSSWTVRLDLSRQSWVEAEGVLSGDLDFRGLVEGGVQGSLVVRGEGVRVGGQEVSELELDAGLRGRVVEGAALNFGDAAGSRFGMEVESLDLGSLEVGRFTATGNLGSNLVERLVGGRGVGVGAVQLDVAAKGAIAEMRHQGRVVVESIRLAGMRESRLELGWEGEGQERVRGRVDWRTDVGWVTLGVETAGGEGVRVTELEVGGGSDVPLRLEGVTGVALTGVGGDGVPGVTLGALHLTNGVQSLLVEGGVEWPDRGSVNLGVEGVDSGWAGAFVLGEMPDVRLDRLKASAVWDEGPMRVDLEGAGEVVDALEGVAERIFVKLAGGGEGVRLERLGVAEGEREWVRAEGELPVVLGRPGSGAMVRLVPDGGMRFHLDAEPSPAMEDWLMVVSGLELEGARCEFDLAGTLVEPRGRLSATVGSVGRPGQNPGESAMVLLEELSLGVGLEPERLALETMRVRVGGQEMRVSAALPLAAGMWESLLGGEVRVDWGQLEGEAVMDELALSRVNPQWLGPLRPEGVVDVQVRMLPGWRLEGEVGVSGLSTRAFPLLGPIRDINGRLALQDQQAVITGMEADWGGETVRLSGLVDTAVCWRKPGELPALDLRVTGANLPLARQAGLIVRGDLDLALVRSEEEPVVVRGAVDLQRSFVLSDLDSLLGVNVRQTSLPPPYFSVTEEPMASWGLDLQLRANRTIHVKSPFYRGVHSMNMRLGGTLRDPLLTGDIQVYEGQALFPYANIPIRQGIVSFSEQNPDAPRLVVMGASRTFGYDLRMEVSGTMSEPAIQFSSVPSLSSEEIVMMITAGELPRHELTTTTKDRVAKLATLIGKDILNKLGSQDAGEERLIFRSGEGISTGGRVTYYLEYRLTDTWGLVGEYDEYDAINAGVKWRLIQR